MSSVLKILPHYTYEDFCQWEGRWELIEGIPYAMSPAPRPKHQLVCANLLSEFRVALKNKNCKECRVYNFIDVKYSDDTIFEPDGLVVCGNIKKAFLDFPPKLVFEVLSPSTALKDIHTKFSFYEKFGILYYLIVDADKETVQIFQLINNQYQEITFDAAMPFNFTFDDGCTIAVTLKNIWE
jgi:Uma2 family endonuclease